MSAEPFSFHPPPARVQHSRHRVALGVMLASGFAGLGYQIVWTQQGALWLGHEAAAVLAVVTAFFAGLAAGALGLGPLVQRSVHPERWYAACELLIAVWSLALALLLAPLSEGLSMLTGAQPTALWQWTVGFCGTFVLLLPATAAMGATLPAMERVLSRVSGASGDVASLYACNTLGAMIGVLATAFWLIPELGLVRTAALCAALNGLCALAALKLAEKTSPAPTTAPATSRLETGSVLPVLAVTGLLGIGYEVLVVRVLSQLAEDTVYTFALLLAVYLGFTALGAAAWQRGGLRSGGAAVDAALARHRLLGLQAAACLLGTVTLWSAESVRNELQVLLGPGMPAALAAEAALALLAFAPATFVMGALFSQLCTQAQAGGHNLGRALGVNTLGAAAAPLLFGVWLVPAVGPKFALLAVAAGYLLLALPHGWRSPWVALSAGAALMLAVAAPSLVFVDVPDGGHVVHYREGTMATVSVVEDADGVRRLRINNRQQEGSSATLPADARQALLPVLLHPSPRRALFLGLGTGVTASAAAEDPGLRVDAAELLPEVIEASAQFRPDGEGTGPPRVTVVAADARRYVRTSMQRYDVIVADNFHPARSGSGSLYTVEHFRAVRARLSDDGLFCQWLPLHQLDLDTLRSIVRSFIEVYPQGTAMLATNSLETPVLGLIGQAGAAGFDVATLQRRLAGHPLPRRLAEFGIVDEYALLGGFVAGPRALATFIEGAPLNTDDRPVVAYRAPRVTYAPEMPPRDRLLALLAQLRVMPGEVLRPGADSAVSRRVAAYWLARDRFLAAGRDVRPTASPQRMLEQVREPLLAVLRTSPDFRPAYDPLLRMAQALERSDVAAAAALRRELAQIVQPATSTRSAP